MVSPLAYGGEADTPAGDALAEEVAENEDGVRIRVEDAHTRILIAQVKLQIGDLVLDPGDDRSLTGQYAIEVPIRSSKNETGAMNLPLRKDLDHYLYNGGFLEGQGFSDQRPDAQRDITCRIIPDENDKTAGTLELAIDTGERIMKFETRYSVVDTLPEATAESSAEG